VPSLKPLQPEGPAPVAASRARGRNQELPRERIARLGAAALSQDELLGLVLTGGSAGKAPAETLLRRFGGLARLARAGVAELKCSGVGLARAAALCAALELGRRVAQAEIPTEQPIRSAAAAFEYLRPRLAHRPVEAFSVLLLDVRLRLLQHVQVAEGTGWSCAVQPRDALVPALREGAAAVVFVHNHPSGDPAPSRDDVEVTRRLVAASQLLGIRPVDHVIIATGGCSSLRELGAWPEEDAPAPG
jgi:DNA repair protein RadC